MFLEYYRSGRTCLGKKISLSDTNRQNWARGAVTGLSVRIKWALERLPYDESLLDTTIERLRLNLTNPIHFADNKPGFHFESGVPTVPDPRFTYFDLWQYGISGEDGYRGFLRDCGLPDSVPYIIVVAATSLLLIDDAIDAMNRDDPWYATWVLYQAYDLFEEMVRGEAHKSVGPEIRSQFASAGGKARHRETDGYKAEVLKEWKTGRFEGNKSGCARWAMRQYPLTSQAVITRWIRKYESGTQQVE